MADVEEAKPKKGEPPRLKRENTSTQEIEGGDKEEDDGWRKSKRRKRKTLTILLGMPWGHHSTPNPSKLEAPRTQASVGPKVPCPSSHPQDLRVECGPLPQVT